MPPDTPSTPLGHSEQSYVDGDAADLAHMTPFWRRYFRRRDAEEATMERTIAVDLTERELHVVTCAMAGNFPPKLNDVRMPTLRKLAKASRALREASADAA